MSRGGLEQYEGVGRPFVRRCVGVCERVEKACLFDGVPQAFAPLTLLGAQQKFGSDVLREQAVGGIVDEALGLVHGDHLSPRPRAMMPRRISRVPPRREKDGAVCVR